MTMIAHPNFGRSDTWDERQREAGFGLWQEHSLSSHPSWSSSVCLSCGLSLWLSEERSEHCHAELDLYIFIRNQYPLEKSVLGKGEETVYLESLPARTALGYKQTCAGSVCTQETLGDTFKARCCRCETLAQMHSPLLLLHVVNKANRRSPALCTSVCTHWWQSNNTFSE